MTKLKVISIHRTGNGKPFGIFTNPRMMNSDQEYQFTSQWYIDFVKKNGIHRSMDEKSRWAHNIMIEKWFRSFKYEETYI